jgi:hypothetical protein
LILILLVILDRQGQDLSIDIIASELPNLPIDADLFEPQYYRQGRGYANGYAMPKARLRQQ